MESDSDDDSLTVNSTNDDPVDVAVNFSTSNECAMTLPIATEDFSCFCTGSISSPLHTAVLEYSMELLDDVLQLNPSDVNCKDEEGKTPLMKAIGMYRNDCFIMHLLDAGCDPNIADKYGETPLHVAVTRPKVYVAYELIKRGADVDAQASDLRTPLHQAVDYSNTDAVCLLLYYGAHVNVLSKNKTTPLMNALSYGDMETSELLVNYYDNDDCLCNVEGYSTLYFAMQRRSTLAVRFLEMGADVNYVTPHGENLLVFSLFYSDATLFKLMWYRFDYRIILKTKTPFLASYIKNCCFEDRDWVECLRLVLTSPGALELVQHYNDHMSRERNEECSFFQELLKSFYRNNIGQLDRLTIIYMALNLRAEVSMYDLIKAYEFYGFHDELEIFIYFANYARVPYKQVEFKFLLIPFILGLEDELHANIVICRKQNYVSTSVVSLADDEHEWLGFFARFRYDSLFRRLPTWWISQHCEVEAQLQLVPEFPSLLELSRNPARRLIRRMCGTTMTPYRFHDVVKSLNLPQHVKDIILFKKPVYNVSA